MITVIWYLRITPEKARRRLRNGMILRYNNNFAINVFICSHRPVVVCVYVCMYVGNKETIPNLKSTWVKVAWSGIEKLPCLSMRGLKRVKSLNSGVVLCLQKRNFHAHAEQHEHIPQSNSFAKQSLEWFRKVLPHNRVKQSLGTTKWFSSE